MYPEKEESQSDEDYARYLSLYLSKHARLLYKEKIFDRALKELFPRKKV